MHQPTSWKTDEALELMRSFDPDLCVMAYVTLLVPQRVLDAPRRGTIQYHPSLLPKHRGPSSINWPIIQGETRTGLTIFWPDEADDPILLQKEVEIGPHDTLGSLYFNHLFPMGVDAIMEAVDLVRAGKAPRTERQPGDLRELVQEGRRSDRLEQAGLRGLQPDPRDGPAARRLDSDRRPGGADLRQRAEPRGGSTGTVLAVADDTFEVGAQGGSIVVKRVRPQGGKKMAAGPFAKEAGLKARVSAAEPGPEEQRGDHHMAKSDIEIAREATMLPIGDIAAKLGVSADAVEPYGKHIAKSAWSSSSRSPTGPTDA